MVSILNHTFQEIKDVLIEHDLPANRAYPLFGWIFRKTEFDFSVMSDLSKEHRAYFAENFRILELKEVNRVASPDDEAVKFLYETKDGFGIESVLLRGGETGEDDDGFDPRRLTVCISTQVGCALECAFCATGQLGFKRNLTTAEILSQILMMDRYAKDAYKLERNGRAINNIVFMGMGEPFLNYDSLMKAIHILNFSGGFHLGARHITISTAGIIEKIQELAETGLQVRLAVSLNSANHEKRKVLMPVARSNNTGRLLTAIRDYQDKTNRRVTFEYVLVEGVNDKEEDVLAMKHELKGIRYNLNLIPYNDVSYLPFEALRKGTLDHFKALLRKHAIPFVQRYSKGTEIAAACGQLGMEMKK